MTSSQGVWKPRDWDPCPIGSTMVSLAAFPGGDVARSILGGRNGDATGRKKPALASTKSPGDVKETQTDKYIYIVYK